MAGVPRRAPLRGWTRGTLARTRRSPRRADEPGRRLVRHDGRVALRAACDQHRRPPLTASTCARTADRKRQPALPAPARAALPQHARSERGARRARPQWLRDELRGRSGISARTPGDGERASLVRRRSAERVHPLDRPLLVSDDRGGRVPRLRLDGARAPRRAGLAPRPLRRRGVGCARRGDSRADAVRRLARRAAVRALDSRARVRSACLATTAGCRCRPGGRCQASRPGRGVRLPRARGARLARRRSALERTRNVFDHRRGKSVSARHGPLARRAPGADRPWDGDPSVRRGDRMARYRARPIARPRAACLCSALHRRRRGAPLRGHVVRPPLRPGTDARSRAARNMRETPCEIATGHDGRSSCRSACWRWLSRTCR